MIDSRYLAGVMDSDGSFSITKHHIKRPNCSYVCTIQLTWSLTDKSKSFMEDLVTQYGGSYFCGFPSGKTHYPNTKKVIKYNATASAAEKIVKDVLPHLILKKQQAENILKARALVCPLGTKNRPQEITDKLQELYIKNKELNTKNKGSL